MRNSRKLLGVLTVATLLTILNPLPLPFTNLFPAFAQSNNAIERKAEADLLIEQGLTQASIQQWQEAIGSWEQALAIYRETIVREALPLESRRGEMISLTNLGSAYFILGQYQEAIAFYEQILSIAVETNELSYASSSLNALGNSHLNLGQYQDAENYHEQALSIARGIEDESEKRAALEGLGNVYLSLGEYQRAIYFHEQSLEIAQNSGNRLAEGLSLGNLGIAYFRIEQYDRAVELFKGALAIQYESGNIWEAATSLSHIGMTYHVLQEDELSIYHLDRALAIMREINYLQGEAAILNNLGKVYDDSGQHQLAIDYFQQAFTITQVLGSRDVGGITLSNLGRAYASLNQDEPAIIFLKASVDVRESIRGDITGLETDLQQSFTNTIADDYRFLADLLLQQNRVLEAQRVLDLLKVQELDEYLHTVRGNAETASGVAYWRPEQEILDRYQTLQDEAVALARELDELEARAREGTITPAEEERRVEITRLQRELKTQFNDFIASEDIQGFIDELKKAGEVYDQTVSLDSLTRQKDDLEELQAVLFYPLVLEDRLELIVVAPNAEPIRRTVENVGREQLNAVITEFRRALDSPGSDATAPAQQLYRWLIEPLEPDLAAAGVETIIYAPDGALRYIPLAALHDGEQWLVERFRINNITAVSLEEWDTPPAGERRILAGAFADEATAYEVGGTAFQGLPYAGKEVEILQTTMPSTTALFDGNFSLNRVLDDIGLANVLHFATHAAVMPGDASESFILFGNGDAPNLRDISNWSLDNVDLVVLSACETGLGGFDNNGEQILGLGYQFQNQGARAVIASLWQVNDGGTQALMNAFYSALQEQNMSKAEALRQAQIALITNNYDAVGGKRGTIEIISTETGEPITSSRLSHPYYWAPFILIGNGL
jgi:CHAT domain-containing protein/tetratricopeptide (TPR) repeat protein